MSEFTKGTTQQYESKYEENIALNLDRIAAALEQIASSLRQVMGKGDSSRAHIRIFDVSES